MRTKSWRWLASALGLAWAATGCGDGDTGHGQRPDLVSCTSTWETLYQPDDDLRLNEAIVYHRDRAFVVDPLGSPPQILSLEPATRKAALFRDLHPLAMWGEGDHILLLQGFNLVGVPLEGGALRTVVETGLLEERRRNNTFPTAWSVDAEALYWARMDYTSLPGEVSWTFWRGARDGSGNRRLGEVVDRTAHVLPDRSFILSDRILFAESDRSAKVWSMPKGGGDVTTIDVPARSQALLTVGPDGKMLWRRLEGDGSRESYSVVATGPAGARDPSPVVTPLGPRILPASAWPDGRGGFVLQMIEFLSEGAVHSTYWRLPGTGQPTRLVCDPQVGRLALGAAVGSDAMYLVMAGPGFYREVARFPL